MLLIIIGLAVIVTCSVTNRVADQEVGLHNTRNETVQTEARAVSSNRPTHKAFYSTSYIPTGCVVESKQVEQRNVDALEVWDDAASQSSDIIGHTAKHAIPTNTQIRQGDLQ